MISDDDHEKRLSVQPDVRAAPVSSEEKKKRGGSGLNPSRGGFGGGEAPPAKIRGVWGAAPPSQNRKNFDTV